MESIDRVVPSRITHEVGASAAHDVDVQSAVTIGRHPKICVELVTANAGDEPQRFGEARRAGEFADPNNDDVLRVHGGDPVEKALDR